MNKQLVEVHPHTCLVLWQAHCCLCLLHSPREEDRPPTPTYKPMAYNTLRTTCLDSAKQRIQQALKQWDNRAKTTGITICIDGWSDAQNRPILNVLAVCPKGAMFLGAVDTSGQVKSAEYIAQVLTEYIEAVGADRVVQVRALIVCACCHTDTANYFATCFAMGRQLSSTSRDIAAYTAHQPRGTDGLPEFACTLSVNTTYEILQLTVAVVSLMFASRCALTTRPTARTLVLSLRRLTPTSPGPHVPPTCVIWPLKTSSSLTTSRKCTTTPRHL